MICNYLLICLFGTLACLLEHVATRETILDGIPILEEMFRNKFPYQVSVQIHGQGHVCGGGIVHERFILTAAHCVLNRERLLRSKHIYVLAGTANIKKPISSAVNLVVDKVYFPKEFHPTIEFNVGDIALLRLVDALPLKRHRYFKKLELPWNFEDRVNETGLIVGFGWNEINSTGKVGVTDGRLRLAVADILSDDECEEFYPPGAVQRETHICATIKPKRRPWPSDKWYGVCTGDTGSPLVEKDTKTIVGILSKIPDLCETNEEASIYVRVVYYVANILNILIHGRDPQMVALET